MKKLNLISIVLLLLFAFAGCSDSYNVSAPSGELSNGAAEKDRNLSESNAQSTVMVQLQPIGGAVQWQLRADLTSYANGQFRGSGTFEIPVLGGIVIVPILGIMHIEQNSSGGVDIHLKAHGQQPGVGEVQLSFLGTGNPDPATGRSTVTGPVAGSFSAPDFSVELNGKAVFDDRVIPASLAGL